MRRLIIPPNRPRIVTAVDSKFVPTLFSFFRPITLKARAFYRLCIIFKNWIYVTETGIYYDECPIKVDLRKSLMYVGSNPNSKSFGVWRECALFHKITTVGETSTRNACETVNFVNFKVPQLISRRTLNNYIVETYRAFEVGKKTASVSRIFNCWLEICSVCRTHSDRFGFVSLGHADFSPWNIVTNDNDQIIIFDWDDSLDAQPYLVDMFNYIWIQFLVNGNISAFLKGCLLCWRLRLAFNNLHLNRKVLIANFAFLFHRRELISLRRRKIVLFVTLTMLAIKRS